MTNPDTSDFIRLSSGPLGNKPHEFLSGNLELDFENEDDDDGPPSLQMTNEELAALQSRFRLECDTNSESDESDDDEDAVPISKPVILVNHESGNKRLTSVKSNSPTPPCSAMNGRTMDESSCFPTDSMILENKTIYENMLNDDPINQTNVDKWQAINRPKYIARPDGWNFARSNDLVHLTPDEYLALRSEPIGSLGGDSRNITAFEMAGLLPSTSPASSASPCNIEDGKSSTEPPSNEIKQTQGIPSTRSQQQEEAPSANVSVNIDYLLQPSDPVTDTTLESSTVPASNSPNVVNAAAKQKNPNALGSNGYGNIAPSASSTAIAALKVADRASPVSGESHSYRSNSANGSVSFSFNNGSAIADVTDPDLAAVDAMLEMYDADVDPDELAEHIMMRFGVNPQRPGSTSGIFRDNNDESLLRPPNRGGLSLASVVSSTPKSVPGQKVGSRPNSAQSASSRKADSTATSQVTLENVTIGRGSTGSGDTLPRVPSSNSVNNVNRSEKRISAQSASPRSSTSTTSSGFMMPAKVVATTSNGSENNRTSQPALINGSKVVENLSQSSLSLSSFDASTVSEYAPVLTPVAEKGPFIRLEWDKHAIDMKEPVFVGQSHDITLSAKNTGRLWVQLSATLQNAKVDGQLLPGAKGFTAGLHILNSTVVIEPNASGTFRLRFAPSDVGFYSANIDIFACVVGSVVEESRTLPPIPFAADVRLPNVGFVLREQQEGSSICDFGALPAGASRRIVCSLRFSPPPGISPGSSTFALDVPIVVTIRPESAWRCFHFLPSTSANNSDLLKSSKSITTVPTPMYGAGHVTKLYLSAVHQQHDFVVCFTARYDTELPTLKQGLDINEAELVAQTDSTPPRHLATVGLKASVGIVSLKAVGLDQNADDSTTLRMTCQLRNDGRPPVVSRSFFLLNSGSIGVDVSTSIASSPSSQVQQDTGDSKMFTATPTEFCLLPKQKLQMNVQFQPMGLGIGEMCAGFLSFFTDPPQSGSPGQLPVLDVSLIGVVSEDENRKLQRAATSSVPTTPASTSSQMYDGSASRSNSQQRPVLSVTSNSGSECSANSSASSISSRRTLVTSHQRVVWWGSDVGQSVEQIVNLRNVGTDEVSVRISIRDQNSEQPPAFILAGATQSSSPLLATLPPSSDFPMRVIFKAQPHHQQRVAVAKMQIKVLASGPGSVPPGVKFCIPLFGAAGSASVVADGVALRTTSAGHYYAIVGTVPAGCRRSMRLSLRNNGIRTAFFTALPFADMSCTQRLGPSKLVCMPPQACIAPGDTTELTLDLYVGDREAALCAERSYIVACLQIVYGDNDLRVLAGRALSSVKSSEVRRHLDEAALELIQGSENGDRRFSGSSTQQTEAWPEHMRLFSRHCRRLYVALVGEKTSATEGGGNGVDDETLQHTMLLDDTQATIMLPPSFSDRSHQMSLASLVEQRTMQPNSAASFARPLPVSQPSNTVSESSSNRNGIQPSNSVAESSSNRNGIRLLPSELLLTALSDSRTLMLINDTSLPTDFEAEWAAHVLVVEPPRGTLPPNGTATVHVRLSPGAGAFVDPVQQQWVGRLGVRTASGPRLESVVRVHLSSMQPSAVSSNTVPQQQLQLQAASSIQRTGSVPRQMQSHRSEPVVQITFGSRDCPHPPAARLDFGKVVISSEQQRKLSLRLANEQPFPVNWQLEELTAYALASLPGTNGTSNGVNGANSRCVSSIFSFTPAKSGSLAANGGQVLLKCLFQPPPQTASPKQPFQLPDTNYLQHFLLTVKGTTGWTAETRISVVASVVSSVNGQPSSANNNMSFSSNMADQSNLSRVSNSSAISVAPLSAAHTSARRAANRASASRNLVCPGEKHEFKKVVRPGETVKEKVNLENRSNSLPLHVEIVSGPSAPFSTKHRRFTIEPMHYLHLPVVFKPVAPGSFRSEMTLQSSTSSPPGTGVPDEVLTISLLAQAGL